MTESPDRHLQLQLPEVQEEMKQEDLSDTKIETLPRKNSTSNFLAESESKQKEKLRQKYAEQDEEDRKNSSGFGLGP